MGKLLFLLFTVVPVVEITLLVEVGGIIGGWPTVALVLFTGALGAALAKREGLRVLRAWQSALDQGRMPSEGVLSGLLILVGGVLLVTPGMITDVLGLALLVPFTRHLVEGGLKRFAASRLEVRSVGLGAGRGAPSTGAPFASAAPAGDVVEGEVVDVRVDLASTVRRSEPAPLPPR